MSWSRVATCSLAVTAALVMGVVAPGAAMVAPASRTSSSSSSTSRARPLYRTVRVPGRIDPTGRRNVSSALQAFIDQVPDRRTIVFPDGATYLLGSDGLRLSGRHRLELRGRATFRITGCGSSASAFSLTGSTSRITFRHLSIVGGNPYGGTSRSHRGDCQHQHGIALYGVSRITIAKVRIRDVWGDCLYVGMDGSRWSRDVRLRDSSCRRNGRQGVAIVGGDDIRVYRSVFDRIAMSVLDIEPNDRRGGATDIRFEDNKVTSFSHASQYQSFLFGANGSMDAMVNRVTVRDNLVTRGTLLTLVGDEWTGYSGQRTRRNIRFTGNRSRVAATRAVLNFKHVDGVLISGNRQPLGRGGSLVRFVDSTGISNRQR